jgi:Ca2+/Na+ antiporter
MPQSHACRIGPVAIIASFKEKPEIIIGNVIGSNIFNTFGVMGIPHLLGHLIFIDVSIMLN